METISWKQWLSFISYPDAVAAVRLNPEQWADIFRRCRERAKGPAQYQSRAGLLHFSSSVEGIWDLDRPIEDIALLGRPLRSWPSESAIILLTTTWFTLGRGGYAQWLETMQVRPEQHLGVEYEGSLRRWLWETLSRQTG